MENNGGYGKIIEYMTTIREDMAKIMEEMVCISDISITSSDSDVLKCSV